MDEPVANRAFANLTELEAVLIACCRPLEAEPQHLKAHSPFPWWPSEPLPGCPSRLSGIRIMPPIIATQCKNPV